MASQAKKEVTRKDYEILRLLIDKPCIKIKELSERTQVSRVTLRRRLKIYDRRNIIKRRIAFNKEKLDITFAIISANFKSVKALENHIKTLKECPHVLVLITNVAQYDLLVVIYGLSEQQTRSFFLSNFYSDSITFKSFLHVPKTALIHPTHICIDTSKKKSCDKDCNNCKFYIEGLCEGCILHVQLRRILKKL